MRKSIDIPETLLEKLYKMKEEKYSTFTLGQMIVLLLINETDEIEQKD